VVDLTGNCVEGLQMKWVKYLVNQLKVNFREAKDESYKFHFSWMLILIVFTSWDMSEGVTFPDIESFEPLVVKLTTLWDLSNMGNSGNRT
jgi:hypothetical protein